MVFPPQKRGYNNTRNVSTIKRRHQHESHINNRNTYKKSDPPSTNPYTTALRTWFCIGASIEVGAKYVGYTLFYCCNLRWFPIVCYGTRLRVSRESQQKKAVFNGKLNGKYYLWKISSTRWSNFFESYIIHTLLTKMAGELWASRSFVKKNQNKKKFSLREEI